MFLIGCDRGLQVDFFLGRSADERDRSLSRNLRPLDRRADRQRRCCARCWSTGSGTASGSVIKFLPQILFLFLFIGILEDSGYLARAALIADRTMARFGLQGKSFIPLLSAYACAVPAIMATRTIENKRDRIATILIAPFMTCSARLPIYMLVIAAFIPHQLLVSGDGAARAVRPRIPGGDSHRAAAEIDRAEQQPVVLHAGNAAVSLAHSPIAGAAAGRPLESLPAPRRHGDSGRCDRDLGALLSSLLDTASPPADRAQLRRHRSGHAIEPAIRPLGFNWKIGIGLMTSLAAREVIVGTLGTIYGMEGTDEHSAEPAAGAAPAI